MGRCAGRRLPWQCVTDSKNYVAQVWRERNLRPWKTDAFKLSTDPQFEEKLQDVIGLYVNPPEHAVVFSFNEKTQIQTLDRTQPSLPIRPRRNRTMTHDYKRNGTVDLFAALDVATGEVLTQTRRSHTGADVLAFFEHIDRDTPDDLDVHVILDNLSAHKSKPVREWLAHPRRERWRLHFTPTSSRWANLIEGWFSILTRKALKTAPSTQSLTSRTSSMTGQRTGTTTNNRCAELNPPKKSSPKPYEPKNP